MLMMSGLLIDAVSILASEIGCLSHLRELSLRHHHKLNDDGILAHSGTGLKSTDLHDLILLSSTLLVVHMGTNH